MGAQPLGVMSAACSCALAWLTLPSSIMLAVDVRTLPSLLLPSVPLLLPGPPGPLALLLPPPPPATLAAAPAKPPSAAAAPALARLRRRLASGMSCISFCMHSHSPSSAVTATLMPCSAHLAGAGVRGRREGTRVSELQTGSCHVRQPHLQHAQPPTKLSRMLSRILLTRT